MNHYAAPDFWANYHALPAEIQKVADRSFGHLKRNPKHPSLHIKRAGQYWSVRAGIHHRALGIELPDGILWFWIGTHAEYDKLIG